MITIRKIQIMKAISNNLLSRDDASFIMSLANTLQSLDGAIMTILHIGGVVEYSDYKFSDKYTLQEHIVLSNSILDKISDIEVTEEELQELL
jgi:hypothetical protein